MKVFRLSKPSYIDLSGRGAEIYGGRWNSKGNPMVYTSSTRALALAECLVHIYTDIIPSFVLLTIEIPDGIKSDEITLPDLPENWKDYPPNITTQQLGNDFLEENKFPLLKVPSAVVQGEFNYLINPFHQDVEKIKIIEQEKFEFDKRLLKH